MATTAIMETWANIFLTQFLAYPSWVQELRNLNSYLDGRTINVGKANGLPTVSKNPSTFPLTPARRAPGNTAVTLDQYVTDPQIIHNWERIQYAFDQASEEMTVHVDTIWNEFGLNAGFDLTPAAATAAMPITRFSGAVVGTRAKATVEDVIALQQAFNERNVPQAGRVLVLSPGALGDILLDERASNSLKQVHDSVTGLLGNLYGFKIYVGTQNPVYENVTGVKQALGTAETASLLSCSFAFYNQKNGYAYTDNSVYLETDKPAYVGSIMNAEVWAKVSRLDDTGVAVLHH